MVNEHYEVADGPRIVERGNGEEDLRFGSLPLRREDAMEVFAYLMQLGAIELRDP